MAHDHRTQGDRAHNQGRGARLGNRGRRHREIVDHHRIGRPAVDAKPSRRDRRGVNQARNIKGAKERRGRATRRSQKRAGRP